jgi:lysozyme family protein
MARQLDGSLRDEYNVLFQRMSLRSERLGEIEAIHRRITAEGAFARYREVEQTTGIPWFVVAIVHNLESSLRFDRHLHNGDRLTARTVRVPAGRPRPPATPPFSWHDSAIDALKMKRLEQRTDWSVEGIAFVLEGYNGWGYRDHHPHIKSPYLWSGTTNYTRGKYVADGVFSETAVSAQCGGMALLRYMMDQDRRIAERVSFIFQEAADGPITRDFPAVDGPEGTDAPEATPQGDIPLFPGRYLMREPGPIFARDPDVAHVQRRLKALGIPTGTVDGEFGEMTEHGVKLFQARSANAAGQPLEIDGVVGPETWVALFGPGTVPMVIGAASPQVRPTSDLSRTLIEVAAAEVGVRESPIGSNRGPRVDLFIQSVGLDPTEDSFPWCMCFVHWCFAQATHRLRLENLVPRTGGVHAAWQASRELGDRVRVITARQAQADPSRILPGMVFFLDTGGGKGHVGIVSSNVNGLLETIEGNTNDNGSREGIGVFRRSGRRVGSISLGFADYSPAAVRIDLPPGALTVPDR